MYNSNMIPQSPDTLVFSGGGPDGVAFIGCVRWLEDHRLLLPDSLRSVVGCSAGAIVALMLALRLGSADMEAWLRAGVGSGDLTDVDVEGLWTIAERLGVDDGERVLVALRTLLRPRFGDVTDVTFLELAKATGRDLRIYATCLEDSRGVFLSVDTTPHLGVLKAVRMSFSIPLLFTPVSHEGRTYVDGGMFDYCPTAHIETSGTTTFTVVFRIVVPPHPAHPMHSMHCTHAMGAPCSAPSLAPAHTPAATCTEPADADADADPTKKPSASPDVVSYMLMLVRAIMMRSNTTSSAARKDSTTVHTVDVPSLLAQDSECTDSLGVSFDLRSMSLVVPSSSIDRYIEHGYRQPVSLGPQGTNNTSPVPQPQQAGP
jgi:predicted acylesterase/phospholipase RssA